jgi:hypothetical protein
MSGRPSATLQVSATQALNGQRLVGAPLRLMGWSFNDGNAAQSKPVTGTANAPGAGATIASISLLSGTPGAADINNVGVFVNVTQIATSENLGVSGNYPQQPAQALVTFGPLTLAFEAIGAAAAGSVYTIVATVTAINNSIGQILDGSGEIARSVILPGGVDNEWFGDSGIAIDTELRVQTITGTVQGTLFYYYAPEVREAAEQLPVQEN